MNIILLKKSLKYKRALAHTKIMAEIVMLKRRSASACGLG
jgi:hypothetical protein